MIAHARQIVAIRRSSPAVAVSVITESGVSGARSASNQRSLGHQSRRGRFAGPGTRVISWNLDFALIREWSSLWSQPRFRSVGRFIFCLNSHILGGELRHLTYPTLKNFAVAG